MMTQSYGVSVQVTYTYIDIFHIDINLIKFIIYTNTHYGAWEWPRTMGCDPIIRFAFGIRLMTCNIYIKINEISIYVISNITMDNFDGHFSWTGDS